MSEKKCKVYGCNTEQYAKGYCTKHYLQIRKHGKLTSELEIREFTVC